MVCVRAKVPTRSLPLLVSFVSMFAFMIVSSGEECSETRVGDLIELCFNGQARQCAICGTLIYLGPCNPE